MLDNLDLMIVLGRIVHETDLNSIQRFLNGHIVRADIVTQVSSVQDMPAVRVVDLPHFHRQEDKGNRVLRLLLIRSFRLYVKGQRDYSIPWS